MMNQYNAERMTNEAAAQTRYQPVGGAMLGSMADVPERDLQSIITRIAEATEQACKSCERIHEIAHRVKGPIPGSDEACGLASGGGGDIGEIHTRLDTLFNILQRSSDGLKRLETL